MNILFVANCLPIYGANRSMLDLAIALQKRGYSPHFVFPKRGHMEDKHNLHIELDKYNFIYAHVDYCWDVHGSNSVAWFECMLHNKVNQNCILELEQYVRQWDIDIIHTNSSTNLIGAEIAKRMNKPHVWHVREALKAHYSLRFDNAIRYRRLFKKAARIICISEWTKENYKEIMRGTKTKVLYNGFKIDNYILHDSYNIECKFFNLIICGVISEGKRQLDAVKAIQLLVNEYNCNNIHLKIVGGGNGKYFDDICRYIETNHLSKYIEIVPFQKDLRLYREEADIALMCSDNEALGRVTIESMLSENIVIGANVAGTAEIIEDGFNGYLYESGDVESLCKKILFVMQHWKEQGIIVKNAKQYACENFDSEKYADKVSNIYQDIKRKDSEL